MPQAARTDATAAETKVDRRPIDDRGREANDRPINLHDHLLRHQRTVGNRAVQRLIESPAPAVFLKPSSPRRDTRKEESERGPAPAVAKQSTPTDTPARVVSLPPRAHVNKSAGAPGIQRAWYNFDIPFTDYQFDPSIEGIKTAAGVVKDTAVEAFDWIVDKIRDLVSAGVDWLTEKWNALKEFAESAFAAAKEFFANIIGFIKSPLSFLADAVMRFDEQSVAKAWATFSGLVSTVANNFRLLTDNLLNPISTLWNKLYGYGSSLLDKVSGLFDIAALRTALPHGDKALVGNKGYRKFLKSQGARFAIDEAKVETDARYDGLWVLRTDTDLEPRVVALAYKHLWMVEAIFRSMKSLLETRPIYHHGDDAIRGHVFCSFLALVLRQELQRRLAAKRWTLEWADRRPRPQRAARNGDHPRRPSLRRPQRNQADRRQSLSGVWRGDPARATPRRRPRHDGRRRRHHLQPLTPTTRRGVSLQNFCRCK